LYSVAPDQKKLRYEARSFLKKSCTKNFGFKETGVAMLNFIPAVILRILTPGAGL
jgi:hypothetical protein